MNDFILVGILFGILFLIFSANASKNPYLKKFFTIFPPLLMCYFLPSLLHSPLGLFNPEVSKVPSIGVQFCLPACLILFCLSLNLKEVISLGPKLLTIFLVGSFSVVIGGPIAMFIFIKLFPNLLMVDSNDLWRGLSTIAGSWIGGSVNQTAMKEVYHPSEQLFAAVLIVDVAVATLWMSLLLFLAGKSKQVDKFLKAKDQNFNMLMKHSQQGVVENKNPQVLDYFKIFAVAFGGLSLSHFLSNQVVNFFKTYQDVLAQYSLETLSYDFFWLVFFATTIGIILSNTKLRQLEAVGSMNFANVLLYFLITTIGLKIDLSQVFKYWPLFILGIIWMLIHAICIFSIGRKMKLPLFYIATSSMANIGGAASAPVVASAFNEKLAPIGVLLAILGYAIGNYGGMVCAWLMQLLVN